MVHQVAQRGFGREAAAYERSRPTYPPDALSWLVTNLRMGKVSIVADLAAGTGKLTRLLLPTGAAVLAIEPVQGMRDALRMAVPEVPVIAASAEAIPLGSGTLDAVTVAQAFHWFDADKAFAELGRVLRPGGRLGVISNSRDRSVDWVDRAWAIMDRVESTAPWRDHDWRVSAFKDRPAFTQFTTATIHHEHSCVPEDVVDRFRGVSHIAALPPDQRAAALAEIRGLLDTHSETRGRSELQIPYRVDCSWCERRPER